MENEIEYITPEKKKMLEEELVNLSGAKRKEILLALQEAKALGDLSENAEYHQAREDQGKLEERIQKIEHILKNSKVIEKKKSDSVRVGSTVVVEKQGSKDQKTYSIVGSEDSDTLAGKISNHSPLGEALFGKKKGEVATFNAPSGVINYKIISVS
jgi:transcription elongation factor GreA